MIDSYLASKPWGEPGRWERCKCPSCGAVRRFYCPRCRKLVGAPPGLAGIDDSPLALRIDVILRDDQNKSTGVHTAVLAPSSVNVLTFPDEVRVVFVLASAFTERRLSSVPRFFCDSQLEPVEYDAETTVVLYPSPSSMTLAELPPASISALRTVVVVDAKWTKTVRGHAPMPRPWRQLRHISLVLLLFCMCVRVRTCAEQGGVLEHRRLRGLRHVRLAAPPAASRFWRYHDQGPGCVSTVEALVLLFTEFRAAPSNAVTRAAVASLGPPPLLLSGPPLPTGAGHGAGLIPEARLLFLFGLISAAIAAQAAQPAPHAHHLPPTEVRGVEASGGAAVAVLNNSQVFLDSLALEAEMRAERQAAGATCATEGDGAAPRAGSEAQAGSGGERSGPGLAPARPAVLPMDEAAKEQRRARKRQAGTGRQALQVCVCVCVCVLLAQGAKRTLLRRSAPCVAACCTRARCSFAQ